jgi:hypothetical protein
MNFDCILLRPEQHAKQKPLMHSALSHSAIPSLCAAVAATAGSYSGIEEAAVEEPVSAGGLEGTFTRPHKVSARGPAVLIISGSGPTDRDGNQSERKTNTYRMLATGLVAAGIRSLRYDKRGMGGSQASSPASRMLSSTIS